MLAALVAACMSAVWVGFAFALAATPRTRVDAICETCGPREGEILRKAVDERARATTALVCAQWICGTAAVVFAVAAELRTRGEDSVVWATLVSSVFVGATWSLAARRALEGSDRIVPAAARAAMVLSKLPPVSWVVWVAGVIGRAARDVPGVPEPVSEQEVLAVADAAARSASIERDERELIEAILRFGDVTVRDVMVPRTDMVTVSKDFRVGDAMEVVLLNGYSRLPVYGEGPDDVVGILYAKDLMRAERDGEVDATIERLVRPAHFVPESKRISELLREMQREQFHIAIVVDEYGGTAGLVTLEDLIEELVGEIVDEFDRVEERIEPLPGGAVRVDARMQVGELNELLGLDLPVGDWTTVGGLFWHLAGHPPTEGEVVRCDHHQLRAERVKGRRIGKVRISPVAVDGVDRSVDEPATRTPHQSGDEATTRTPDQSGDEAATSRDVP